MDTNIYDYGNSGKRNTGNFNSGNFNVGNFNIGSENNGDYNVGSMNGGRHNIGHCNGGDHNKGFGNTGDYNSCDFSAGVFCTQTPEVLIFDQPSGMTLCEWRDSDAAGIIGRVKLTEWIPRTNMTHAEKAGHPEYTAIGGYLRNNGYNESFIAWWDGLSDKEKDVIISIPNFDKDKFKGITGIEV